MKKKNLYSSLKQNLLSVSYYYYYYYYYHIKKLLINVHTDFFHPEDEGPSVNRLPDVRHTDGRLLLPNEYRSKLQNNSIVMVDVHFEL